MSFTKYRNHNNYPKLSKLARNICMEQRACTFVRPLLREFDSGRSQITIRATYVTRTACSFVVRARTQLHSCWECADRICVSAMRRIAKANSADTAVCLRDRMRAWKSARVHSPCAHREDIALSGLLNFQNEILISITTCSQNKCSQV